MKLKFLFFGLLFTVISFAQNTAKISGIVLDKDSKQPVSFVSISLKGTMINAESDINGNYEMALKPGSYTIVYAFIGYKTFEKQVTVADNETLALNVSLQENSNSIEGIVIKGTTNKTKETALLKEQQKAVEIKQSIGAQEMSRKGISDVEEGLTKISGITKVGSRGLFVRGLEDRYNNVLINGLAAPSNNPFQKIVPLDLIPSDVVNVIETYKTFNTNIYGDFAGATFNIVTTTKPNSSLTKFTLGAGYTTNNNLRDFYTNKNGLSAKNFFGFGVSDRELPSVFGSSPYPIVTISKDEAKNAYPNGGFSIEKISSPLNTSIGIFHSEKFKIKEDNFSYLLSINFDNTFQYRKGADRTLQFGQYAEYSNNFTKTTYNYKTNLSSIAGLNYSNNRLSLSTNVLYLKSTDAQITDQLGYQNAQKDNTNYLLRTNQLDNTNYLNGQLFGEYFLTSDKSHTIKGGLSLAKTAFSQPDRNSYSGTQVAENAVNVSYGGNNFLRQYLDVKNDMFKSAFLEYSVKFAKDHKLTLGYNGNENSTASSYRFINTIKNFQSNGFFVVNPFEVDEQINADLTNYTISFQEQSNANWKAKVSETVHAGFANMFYKFSDKFEANVGIRAEKYDRLTKFKDIGSFIQNYKKIKNNELYLLPSLNLKYTMSDTKNLRFAASQTYTKPVLMESFPIQIVNPDGTVFQGNPNLVNSKNTNIDLKFEAFPTDKEMFAVGLFGKNIDNPIERTFLVSSGSNTTTFLNSDKAVLYGVEAEFILDFKRFSNMLDNLSLGFNTSIMDTKVTVPNQVKSPSTDGNLINSVETHKSRNLQGASKWLINSDLKYQFNMIKDYPSTITAVYSVFGKRIYSVGTNGLDHIYELPVNKLDLIWNNKLSKNIDLKLSADNILNPAVKFDLGTNNKTNFVEASNTLKEYKRGVGFSFSLNYTF